MFIDFGNGKLSVDETSRQFFCNLVTSKRELPLATIRTRVGWGDMYK
jgi:hypothetical protein